MTGDNEKTQPQELLEEVIGVTHHNEDEKFPTVAEQEEYWRKKEVEEDHETTLSFTCPTCLRRFRNPQAVRMHVARVHTKTVRTPKKKQVVALQQNPTGLREVTDKNRVFPKFPPETGRPVETLDTRRKKWSLARRRRFNAKKKRAAFGLPDAPSDGTNWTPIPPPPQEEPIAMIKFCPHCGSSIERFLA